jgi:hypothetical protein
MSTFMFEIDSLVAQWRAAKTDEARREARETARRLRYSQAEWDAAVRRAKPKAPDLEVTITRGDVDYEVGVVVTHPGSAPVYYYRDGSGDPGCGPEFEVVSVSVYDEALDDVRQLDGAELQLFELTSEEDDYVVGAIEAEDEAAYEDAMLSRAEIDWEERGWDR